MKFGKQLPTSLAIFKQNIELRERCKGVHFADLGESFPSSIYLQNLASTQPRTSPVKFARSLAMQHAAPAHLGVLLRGRRGAELPRRRGRREQEARGEAAAVHWLTARQKLTKAK